MACLLDHGSLVAVELRAGLLQFRPGALHLDAGVAVVDLGDDVAGMDGLVVTDRHRCDEARDPRRHRHLVGLQEGVVGGFLVPAHRPPVPARVPPVGDPGKQHRGEDQLLHHSLARRLSRQHDRCRQGRRGNARLRCGCLLGRGRGLRQLVERCRHGLGRGAARQSLVVPPFRRLTRVRSIALRTIKALAVRGDTVHLSIAQLNKTVSFCYDGSSWLTQGISSRHDARPR